MPARQIVIGAICWRYRTVFFMPLNWQLVSLLDSEGSFHHRESISADPCMGHGGIHYCDVDPWTSAAGT